ncbi:UvrD/Rep helicase family protein [Candidatus Kinetoplastibacterium oncopeltii TCC290E]|uniref:DNA 3'-5' helicase n=1 Tax=Candidatus Kinetoplastidibacterium stringomonadis TCC290E TaxID=1208920 RepID=M1M816_9PROT|nr:UvrD-helicase domain-containing protein [Candidatus Kinetoplastibacterium oncopeltii]AGF48160.1 UvrD/Rep helicase family protein [Candidatus Kinetoplastibacterium oncopeltii TCC290E]
MQSCCYLDDGDLRERALDPKESFIIQAPAGSGKTELLTNRILSLLITVSNPEEILAITFTKKAVSEMRNRVIEKLKLGLGNIPSDLSDITSWKLSKLVLERDSLMGWDLIKNPDRINIKTFDSLCFNLISNFHWLSGIGRVPSIAKDDRKHFKAAAFSTINSADDYPYVRSLISHLDINIQYVETCIADMLARRDQWLPILKYCSSRDLLQKELHSIIERDIKKLLSLMPANWIEDLQQTIRIASRIICEDNDSSILVNLLDLDCCFEPNISNLKKIKALASIFLTSKNELRNPKGLNKKIGFPAGSAHRKIFSEWLMAVKDNNLWIPYLAMLRYAPYFITENQWILLSDQLKVLSLSVNNLLLQFDQQEELDFIEISQRSVSILGNKDFLLEIASKISHILVDEFQDTNNVHFKLLETITSGWLQNCGKSIFIVGDPMQSIYRFRGADVGLFLNVVENGIGKIKLFFLRLVSNFRSQLNLVNWINSVFESLFPANNDKNIGAVSYNHSVPINQKLDGKAVSFHPLFSKNVLEDDTLEKFSLQVIRKILENSPDNHPESTAILVNSRNNLGNIIKVLSKNNIPFRAIEITSLSEKPMISDLIQILRALIHPGDRLAWFSVLRSPFCGLKLDTLHKIFGSDHKTPVPVILRKMLDSYYSRIESSDGFVRFMIEKNAQEILPISEYNRLLRVAHVLLHSEYSGLFPFSSWIRYLWDLLEGSSVYNDPDVENDIENVFCLIDRIYANGNIDVDILEYEISKLFITSDHVNLDKPFIEIMTIHKAKGLQFDNVILYGTHHSSSRNHESIMRFENSLGNALFAPIKSKVDDDFDPITKYIQYKDKLRDDYELDRLIYVAVTRAKKRIHIISPVFLKEEKVITPPSDSLLIRLWYHLDYFPSFTSDVIDNFESKHKEHDVNHSLISRIVCDDVLNIEELIVDKPKWNCFWELDYNHKSVIDILIIDWLTQIGKTGIDNYSKEFYRYIPVIKKQLLRKSFFCDSIESAAIFIANVIENFLKDDIGLWILSYKKSYRDATFIDKEGNFFKADVILDLNNKWLLIDYNLSTINKGESIEDFLNRMKTDFGYKLSKYCNNNLIDKKPLNAALCFPIYKLLINI